MDEQKGRERERENVREEMSFRRIGASS